MKLKCDCGNTDPDQFSIMEDRVIWLSVTHKGGEFVCPGPTLKEEMTSKSVLYCDECNVEQEIKPRGHV